ncbi:MAG: B12-binding domain-containing radical SAM protein [Candidatus Sericytochromatia bacterium]
MRTSPWTVRLAQISQRVGEHYYLPYSVGLLQAYAQQHLTVPENYHFLPPLYRRHEREEVPALFAGVDLAGFSVYVWNIRRSLLLAKALRSFCPETLIVLGGPQVPDQAEAFLREHTYVDLCVHGEGEGVMVALLERLPSRDWHGIAGLSWLDDQGVFYTQAPAVRSRDLSAYPSPFGAGVFEPLLAEHAHWFSAFETNRGCPFSCTFCDWGSAIQSKVVRFPDSRLYADLRWLGEKRIKSVFCADANFGILPRDVELAREAADVRRSLGFPKAFQVQTAKNITGRVVEIQQILTEAGLSATAAISLQSLDTQTLRSIKRQNISLEAFREIQQACLARGIYTYTDMIMGLPGETYASFVEGINTVMESGQYNKLMFHDCTLLPNAEMAQPAYRAAHGIQTAEVVIPAHLIPADGVPELMEIVVGTASLPQDDWIQAHVFAWSTSFWFYTHKLLQLVIMVLHETLHCSYIEILTALSQADAHTWPLLGEIRTGFAQSARQQQRGFPYSQQQTLVVTPSEGTYLTPDLTLQIQLAQQGRLDALFAEAGDFLARWAREKQPDYPLALLKEALLLNRRFFFQTFQLQGFALPGVLPQETLLLHYNLPVFYQSRLQGNPVALAEWAPRSMQI